MPDSARRSCIGSSDIWCSKIDYLCRGLKVSPVHARVPQKIIELDEGPLISGVTQSE